MATLEELTAAVEKGQRKIVLEVTPQLLEDGVDGEKVLGAMVAAMDAVGERFKKNEIFVPEMLIAARAMKSGMEILEPVLVEAGIRPEFKAVVGTVKGDLHDIGKNLVAMMLKGANFEVIDLGVDVSPEQFLEAVKEHNPHIIGLSALLTTTMPSMKSITEAIRAAGYNDVKILIGGAPVTQEYADEIGADGYAGDAASAVDAAKAVLGVAS